MKDVLVVGGGPIGSYVARRLAGAGYEVVVLEKKERLGEKVCCTGIISPECIGKFNIADCVVLKRVNGARIFSPSGKPIRLWREEEQACVVDRADFDIYMAKRAMENGAEYRFSSGVSSIAVHDDRVSAGIAGNGVGIEVEARAAVIASGFGSKLVAELGMGEAGDYVVGVQIEVETTNIDEIEVYTGHELATGFFGWLVPTEERRALVGLLTRRKASLYLNKMIALLKERGKVTSDGMEPVCRGITLKPPKKTYGKRVIVVGDAAGQVKPTTGGGIYFGLLSGEIAAEHLKKALEVDDLSSKRLAGYEREWKQKLGQELKICYWARRIFEGLSDKKINCVCDIITKYGIDEALLQDGELSFDWHGKAIVKLAGQKMMSRLSDIIR
ncbi:MAG TPA: NAD(P)/FAD-dependent oxidoreductase [Dehalococcoidia bacterium]|nr:NAD(P)/FAD-dependent oxidoreductase [Dehalococcoidia bacterium]